MPENLVACHSGMNMPRHTLRHWIHAILSGAIFLSAIAIPARAQSVCPNPPGSAREAGGGGCAEIAAITGTLSAAPTSLTYTLPSNAGPGSQTVTLYYQYGFNVAPLFQASVVNSNDIPWLAVSPASGIFTLASFDGTNYTFTVTVTVSADPTRFSAGTSYSGAINYTAAGLAASTSVLLNVTDPAKLTINPPSLSFSYQQGSALPATQNLAISSTPPGVVYTVTASTAAGGKWLNVPANLSGATPGTVTVSVNPANLALGTYTGQITVNPPAGSFFAVPVTLTVSPLTPPKLSVTPLSETFALPANGPPVNAQVTVSNAGGGTLQFTAAADCPWIKPGAGGSGSAIQGAQVALPFTVDPTGLRPQLYTCHITVKDTANTAAAAQQVTVTLAVSSIAQSLSMSQSGMTFTAVASGPQPPSQSFTLANAGTGSLNWTANTQLVGAGSGQPNWLSVNTASGVLLSGQSAAAETVTVNTAGLAAGQYYGSVNVVAPNAANSPQTVSVLLNVQAAAGQSSGAGIQVPASGLILKGTAGNASPAQQQISLFNPGGSALSYTISSSAAWLSAAPASGSLSSGTNLLTVNGSLSGLSQGVQTGTLNLSFGDGSSAKIQVVLLALPFGVGSAVSGGIGSLSTLPRPLAAGVCSANKPSYLVAVFRQPASQSSLQAAVAQPVQVQLVDDCGNPVTAKNGGSAQVTFLSSGGGNNDPALNLLDVGGGFWEGTWTPTNAASSVTLQLAAQEAGTGSGALLQGSTTTSVAVQAVSASAAAQPTGVANAASAQQATPGVVVPGGYVAIYGTGLAGNGTSGATIPLPTTLNGTQVLLGGQPLALSYAGTGQINGVIPQSLETNASYPLVIVRGATQSVPVPITVAAYQPGIYSVDASGSGQGVVEIVGTALLAGPAANGYRPVKSGSEYLSVFATGLGPLAGPNGEAQPADGAAAPLSPVYQTTATVTATIGGVNAPVVFAGLTPTLVALYQVNVQVPAGVPTGNAVPLVVTVTDPATGATYQSNTVTIAIQ